ncbi:RNase adapter RapZ [Kitasatospora sp. NPDC005751]|uniref:RapZ C-terminal domain-containing protein n=1 Tax=Kitasatospora sp. NPDC005751 TaxID=3157064 RepID=UPI0033DD2AF0
MSVTEVRVVSFGYLHGDPPAGANLVLDLRHHFRDPHVDPALRHQSAEDMPVRRAVLATPGIREAIVGVALVVDAFDAGPADAPLTVAVGCAGGRHRAATVAMALARRLAKTGAPVHLTHRDLTKAVVERTAEGTVVAPARA